MEPTKVDFQGKPIVQICAACQMINRPENAKFAVGVDEKIKKELEVVDEQVNKHRNDFNFTHTMCLHHMEQAYTSPHIPTEKTKAFIDKLRQRGGNCPNLMEDDALRHAYMRGLFTPELVQQTAQAQQNQNTQLVERFKKLSGITNA